MRWTAYEILLRLESPMHCGWRKQGNLLATRPYVTGRVMWGALTARIARLSGKGNLSDSRVYQEIGKKVNEHLAYTYFYPALKKGDSFEVIWPWADEATFRLRMMGSYASTALTYPQQSVHEGSLHEIEFISPWTIDDAQPVYLLGYIFEKEECDLQWKEALPKLQFGAERNYGWGQVSTVRNPTAIKENTLFASKYKVSLDNERPMVQVEKEIEIPAHVLADNNVKVSGRVEPLVGREWRSNNSKNRFVGQHIAFNGLCYPPGSRVLSDMSFRIGDFGIWQS
ncbi:MAG: hypothetical protein D6816_13700 [Bacteroidetes bacterium]|nr:MAG: hypothetical protein D6816_13700 [Bacteroidota bacterium]